MESIAAKIEGSENEVNWRLETRFKQKCLQSKEKKKFLLKSAFGASVPLQAAFWWCHIAVASVLCHFYFKSTGASSWSERKF